VRSFSSIADSRLPPGVRFTKENKNYTFNHYNPLIAIPSPVLDLRNVEARTNYSHVGQPAEPREWGVTFRKNF
jgi:hypothetical protein